MLSLPEIDTNSTAWMYAPNGIRYNAICPGGTRTNIGETMDPAKMDAVGSARTGAFNAIISALPGVGPVWPLEPEGDRTTVRSALFLAADESRYINGAIIPADAGWRAA